ncbi:hypothetical protein HanPSC8_Chr17g0749561 [Helianthus annuus]|nr:hypothetical protein HanPSC8_Chr17g0749561 [Helianthus annuus]
MVFMGAMGRYGRMRRHIQPHYRQRGQRRLVSSESTLVEFLVL